MAVAFILDTSMPDKIIFLDIDGVLNTTQRYFFKDCLIYDTIFMIEIDKLKNLRGVIEKTDAKVVLSTSWRRMGEDLVDWLSALLPVVGATPYYQELPDDPLYPVTSPLHRFRGREIDHWLKNNPLVTDWVIADDDGDMLEYQLKRFVQTDGDFGLTETLSYRMMHILNHGHRYKENYEGFF